MLTGKPKLFIKNKINDMAILCEIVVIIDERRMSMIIQGSRNKATNNVYKKVYSLWKSMIDRCYKETHSYYKWYGGVGITVCDRWKKLDYFIEDIDKIKGFDLDKLLKGELSLDKDILKQGNKIYCLKYCMFVSKEENNKYKPNQQKTIIGISPDNEIFKFKNQSEFARNHNLRQSSIGDCLSGKCKTHKKWKFYYE